MIRYDQAIHTPEALAEEIHNIQMQDSGAFLVGSLGRAVLFTEAGADPLFEFTQRGETPLHKGAQARDIDVLGSDELDETVAPFELDTQCFKNRFVTLTKARGTWVLRSEYEKFEEEIHPDIMEPVEAVSVYGIKATTVPAETHLALMQLNGLLRPKDKKTIAFLEQMAKPHGIPHAHYEPFARLAAINQSGWLPHAQQIYRTVIPEKLRDILRPSSGWMKNKLRIRQP